ncbi:transglutaminase family protein [soil metagenome]
MLIRYGYTVDLEFSQPTPVITVLDIHPERRADIVTEEEMAVSPPVLSTVYRDRFGNICRRFMAPAGLVSLHSTGVITDSGVPDAVDRSAGEVRVEDLPSETLMYLMGSRYCDTDKLSDVAWNMFGSTRAGFDRVQTIVDFVHNRIKFGYPFARATRSASEALEEQVGVCRDFAHLAVALCRCMNIPARYTTGYLGDIGVPPDPNPMDFSAWFEAFIGGRWHTFDARHNAPRIGRIVMGYGLDATDVAIVNSFGRHLLKRWDVVTVEAEA